ncbi:uncharacterized protein LOC112574700 [Pomacea canaliculata]|uniref:uncharacterized protein LOC112574700 n=1 Tax=Pomacea canaliculata TaxID=400727 RepID=UPI000D73D203|nr:uncharacterized protein LOC112574700 [Pomacea canaliculata]
MEVSLIDTKPSHLVVVLLVLTALQHCVAQDETPTFSNCYGRQCEVGEFCSQSEPFHGCRLCTEVSVWCTQNISHVREKFSTCLTVCELLLAKRDIKTMQSEDGRDEREHKTPRIYKVGK